MNEAVASLQVLTSPSPLRFYQHVHLLYRDSRAPYQAKNIVWISVNCYLCSIYYVVVQRGFK